MCVLSEQASRGSSDARLANAASDLLAALPAQPPTVAEDLRTLQQTRREFEQRAEFAAQRRSVGSVRSSSSQKRFAEEAPAPVQQVQDQVVDPSALDTVLLGERRHLARALSLAHSDLLQTLSALKGQTQDRDPRLARVATALSAFAAPREWWLASFGCAGALRCDVRTWLTALEERTKILDAWLGRAQPPRPLPLSALAQPHKLALAHRRKLARRPSDCKATRIQGDSLFSLSRDLGFLRESHH